MSNSTPLRPTKDATWNLEDWTSWSRHLHKRNKRPSLFEVSQRPKVSPFHWCRPTAADECSAEVDALHDARRRGPKARKSSIELANQLEEWLARLADRGPTLALAYECLSWADALPWLSGWLPAGPWNALLESLCEVAEHAEVGRLPCHLSGLLFAGELPYLLAYSLPELDRCAEFDVPACDSTLR